MMCQDLQTLSGRISPRRRWMRSLQRLLLPTAIASALLSSACAGASTVHVVRAAPERGVVSVRVKTPPPTRYVKVQRPRHVTTRTVKVRRDGRVWVAGHWTHRHGRYVWVKARWAKPPHRGAVWIAPKSERRGNDWLFVHGYWR